MGDKKHRAGIAGEHLLKQIERFQVQVVRGFVQHEQIGRLGEELCKQYPVLLTSGEVAYIHLCPIRFKEELLQIGIDMPGPSADDNRVISAAYVLNHAPPRIERGANLVKVEWFNVHSPADVPASGGKFTEKQLHESGLA